MAKGKGQGEAEHLQVPLDDECCCELDVNQDKREGRFTLESKLCFELVSGTLRRRWHVGGSVHGV